MIDIHKCAQRIILKQVRKRLVETLQFSTPQGQEVLEWLAEKMLSRYEQVFARNKLDSLLKVAKLSALQISELNDELYRDQLADTKPEIGGHLRMSEAVASLKSDPRTRSIKDRLLDYGDSSATNKVQEAWIEWAFFLSGALFVVAMTMIGIPFGTGIPLYGSLLLETQPHTVTSYMVQRSVDGVNWEDIMCQQQYCVFDSTTAQTGRVVTNRFPQREEARYIRLLPRSWLHMDDGSAGGDLRVGIMGSPENGLSLAFSETLDGQTNQAWLQSGCTKNGSSAGLWASKEDSIGKVQCCLNSPGLHVCTRDGCLTGRDGDAIRVNWYKAKSMCESRGWRLCSKEELNRKASSGCCGSAMAGTNLCGYDEKLVWTNTNVVQNKCRLHSEFAFENVTQVTLDLLHVQWVDGLNVQSAFPEVPSHGPACFYWMWFISIQYVIQSIFVLYKLRLGLTTHRGSNVHNWGMYCSFGLVFLVGIVIIRADSSAPSVGSSNPVCKTQGPPISSVFMQLCIYFAAVCFKFGVEFFCPYLGMYLLPTAAYLAHGSFLFTIGGNSLWVEFLKYVGMIFLAWPIIHITSRFLGVKNIQRQARAKILGDIEKYEDVWEVAGGVSKKGVTSAPEQIHPHPQPHNLETSAHVESINQQCFQATAKIKEERAAAVDKFSLVEKIVFKVGAGPRSWQHVSRYGRTGKYRQSTKDIDILFDEAAILTDCFLDLVDTLVTHETGSRGVVRGPVKRPDRALQKVIRKYYRDPRCLTDLVRCCILLPSISDVGSCLEVILAKSEKSTLCFTHKHAHAHARASYTIFFTYTHTHTHTRSHTHTHTPSTTHDIFDKILSHIGNFAQHLSWCFFNQSNARFTCYYTKLHMNDEWYINRCFWVCLWLDCKKRETRKSRYRRGFSSWLRSKTGLQHTKKMATVTSVSMSRWHG